MIDENNIPSIQPDFERIKKQDNKGLEYWTSRELCTALGYGCLLYTSDAADE